MKNQRLRYKKIARNKKNREEKKKKIKFKEFLKKISIQKEIADEKLKFKKINYMNKKDSLEYTKNIMKGD